MWCNVSSRPDQWLLAASFSNQWDFSQAWWHDWDVATWHKDQAQKMQCERDNLLKGTSTNLGFPLVDLRITTPFQSQDVPTKIPFAKRTFESRNTFWPWTSFKTWSVCSVSRCICGRSQWVPSQRPVEHDATYFCVPFLGRRTSTVSCYPAKELIGSNMVFDMRVVRREHLECKMLELPG